MVHHVKIQLKKYSLVSVADILYYNCSSQSVDITLTVTGYSGIRATIRFSQFPQSIIVYKIYSLHSHTVFFVNNL